MKVAGMFEVRTPWLSCSGFPVCLPLVLSNSFPHSVRQVGCPGVRQLFCQIDGMHAVSTRTRALLPTPFVVSAPGFGSTSDDPTASSPSRRLWRMPLTKFSPFACKGKFCAFVLWFEFPRYFVPFGRGLDVHGHSNHKGGTRGGTSSFCVLFLQFSKEDYISERFCRPPWEGGGLLQPIVAQPTNREVLLSQLAIPIFR